MSDVSAPVDALHHLCVLARAEIREAYLEAKMVVARWKPRPMPEGWR